MADPAYDQPLTRDGVREDAEDFSQPFRTSSFRLANLVSNGDTVASEWTMSATHLGPLTLPTGLIPATNRQIELSAALFSSFDSDGRIRGERRYYDIASMLAQLGLMQ